MRHTRNQPFCWQEKKILRQLRNEYSGVELVKMRTLYCTLTEIESDFNGKDVKYYTRTISTYSGLSRKWVPSGLKRLEKMGIIALTEHRSEDGKFSQKTLLFTPNNITEDVPKTVVRKTAVRKTAVRKSPPLEDSIVLEDNLYKEDSLFISKGNDPELRSGHSSEKEDTISGKELSQEVVEKKKNSTPSKKEKYTSEENKKINSILGIFTSVNPMVSFKNLTERRSCMELIKKFGFDETTKLVELAVSVQGKEFAPTITSPYQLCYNLGKLKNYVMRETPKMASEQKKEKEEEDILSSIQKRREKLKI